MYERYGGKKEEVTRPQEIHERVVTATDSMVQSSIITCGGVLRPSAGNRSGGIHIIATIISLNRRAGSPEVRDLAAVARQALPAGMRNRLGNTEPAMDEPQIYEQLTQVFREVLDQDSLLVTPDLTAKDVEGWDSLTHVLLLMTVQKKFGVKFSASEIRTLARVADLVQLIKQRKPR